jgi:UDP:flavonoid glycosyltransferase YjiC (YdhE family)
MRSSGPPHIAYFVSPHGFGHAARAAAVMSALHRVEPAMRFDIYTRVPQWFFSDSVTGPFTYHSLLSDIGLAQETALDENLRETLARLRRYIPFAPKLIERLAARLSRAGCRLVVCDIAPLGIAVARAAGIPSVLVENFTWDWIYRGYVRAEPRLAPYAAQMRKEFRQADYHVQTEPVCQFWRADLVTGPVSRDADESRRETREKLKLDRRAPAVLITMGGIPGEYQFLPRLQEQRKLQFVVPGTGAKPVRRGNVLLLPHHSKFFHPNLVNACDVVVGKLGYSTVAEAYRAGVPLAFVPRPRFRESSVMARFALENMNGFEIPARQFQEGEWLSQLNRLAGLERIPRPEPNGATRVAEFIASLIH